MPAVASATQLRTRWKTPDPLNGMLFPLLGLHRWRQAELGLAGPLLGLLHFFGHGVAVAGHLGYGLGPSGFLVLDGDRRRQVCGGFLHGHSLLNQLLL